MKKTITEVQKELQEKRGLVVEIRERLEKEKRSMNDEELEQFETLEGEIRSLTDSLKKLEAEQRMKSFVHDGLDHDNPESKELQRNLSFHKCIRAAASKGAYDGFEGELHQEGLKELREAGVKSHENSFIMPAKAARMLGSKSHKRSVSVTGSTSVAGDQGGMTVATEIGDNFFVGALRAASGLGQLGATFISDLQGDFKVPFGKNVVSATWEGEEDTTPDSQLNFDSFTGQPKRVSALVPYTTQMMHQSSINFEAFIQDEIVDSFSRGMDEKAINGSGSGANPKGILQYVANDGVNVQVMAGVDGSELTWADIVGLETLLANSNAMSGNLGYYSNSKVRGYLKRKPKESGGASGYMWNSNDAATPVNGYAFAVSNNVPSTFTKGSGTGLSGLIFADWRELFLLQWGGFEIIIDPYSNKKKGWIEIQIDMFADVKLRRKGAFAYNKQIIA